MKKKRVNGWKEMNDLEWAMANMSVEKKGPQCEVTTVLYEYAHVLARQLCQRDSYASSFGFSQSDVAYFLVRHIFIDSVDVKYLVPLQMAGISDRPIFQAVDLASQTVAERFKYGEFHNLTLKEIVSYYVNRWLPYFMQIMIPDRVTMPMLVEKLKAINPAKDGLIAKICKKSIFLHCLYQKELTEDVSNFVVQNIMDQDERVPNLLNLVVPLDYVGTKRRYESADGSEDGAAKRSKVEPVVDDPEEKVWGSSKRQGADEPETGRHKRLRVEPFVVEPNGMDLDIKPSERYGFRQNAAKRRQALRRMAAAKGRVHVDRLLTDLAYNATYHGAKHVASRVRRDMVWFRKMRGGDNND
jgi:hypothetical protein